MNNNSYFSSNSQQRITVTNTDAVNLIIAKSVNVLLLCSRIGVIWLLCIYLALVL